MDHSWRPPPLPPIPGTNANICPICSTSHFPFCPPPPFFQNPRFAYPQSHNNYYHQRPPPPPPSFSNPQSSLNYNYNPNDGHLGRPPTWYATNPSPYDNIGVDNNFHNAGVSATYGYDGYDNAGTKRMRIEPIDTNRGSKGSFTGAETADTCRVSSDSERILKLIHDHGNAAKVEADLPSEHRGVTDDMGLKRSRDQRDELGQSRFDLINRRLPIPHEVHDPITKTLHDSYHNLQQKTISNVAPPNPNYNWVESKGRYASTSYGPLAVPHPYGGQPPLPASPPPPLPVEPPRSHFFEPPLPAKKPYMFPADSLPSRSAVPENHSPAQVYYNNNAGHHEEFHTLQPPSSEKQLFPLRNLCSEKPNITNASHIFKHPHRASRPDHFVIILRGLPGSGKSYLAKVLRDIEVENGGEAPRIHSMDEYFMTEVEKAEDSDLSKSSGSLRGKRQVLKTIMEYCYEPEMEEAYRGSMLKAFKKTLDEGVYSFVIVDDRNLRVADFAQFWATAKRSGYEVYLVEAAYKDPAGCAARNVHNFTLDDIQKMAQQWEEAPSLYLKMDIKSLLHGDGFDESGIEEVDMDMEDDDDAIDASQTSNVKSPQENVKDPEDDFTPHDVASPVKDAVKDGLKKELPEVKHLSKSKWSNDLSDEKEEGGKKNASALSGLMQAYSKNGKSVHWGDQGGNVGFSISATRKTNTRSLVIGPGSGYNLKSNPLSEEIYVKPARNVEPKSQNVFQEQIRAERESFRAVFDKRRHRIGGFNIDDE